MMIAPSMRRVLVLRVGLVKFSTIVLKGLIFVINSRFFDPSFYCICFNRNFEQKTRVSGISDSEARLN